MLHVASQRERFAITADANLKKVSEKHSHSDEIQQCICHMPQVKVNPAGTLSTEPIHAGCAIVGIEITEAAQAVNKHPFHGSTAFMLGNEVNLLCG